MPETFVAVHATAAPTADADAHSRASVNYQGASVLPGKGKYGKDKGRNPYGGTRSRSRSRSTTPTGKGKGYKGESQRGYSPYRGKGRQNPYRNDDPYNPRYNPQGTYAAQAGSGIPYGSFQHQTFTPRPRFYNPYGGWQQKGRKGKSKSRSPSRGKGKGGKRNPYGGRSPSRDRNRSPSFGRPSHE